MTAAPSPAFEIPAELGRVFEKFIVAEFAYFTPKGEPLCWPVSPYWYPERGVLAISTSLAYPNKADYPKVNPKVAFYFSDPSGSGINGAAKVLVQGDATVLDEDIQANSDRYVRELRAKFPIARIGLNPLSVRFLDFYLPRLWVEITPRRIVVEKELEMPEASGVPVPSETKAPQLSENGASLTDRELLKLVSIARRFPNAIATVRGPDGYPVSARTAVTVRSPLQSGRGGWIGAEGIFELENSPGAGPAALTFHRHALRGTRFQAWMARGEILQPEGTPLFVPKRLASFFGNGLVFPLSAIPEIVNLRKRLHKELARRGKPMPKLRIPG